MLNFQESFIASFARLLRVVKIELVKFNDCMIVYENRTPDMILEKIKTPHTSDMPKSRT